MHESRLHLYFARRRLRPSWIKKWLSGPDKIMPGTLMPAFWMDGEAASEVLDGNADRQLDAMVKLMYEIGTEKLPTKDTKFAVEMPPISFRIISPSDMTTINLEHPKSIPTI